MDVKKEGKTGDLNLSNENSIVNPIEPSQHPILMDTNCVSENEHLLSESDKIKLEEKEDKEIDEVRLRDDNTIETEAENIMEQNQQLPDTECNSASDTLPKTRRSRNGNKLKKNVKANFKNQSKFNNNTHDTKIQNKRAYSSVTDTNYKLNKKIKENELQDEYEFGEPYVLLTQQNGNPITCYMLPQQGSDLNKFIATSSPSIITPQIALPVVSPSTPQKSHNQAILITPKGVAKTLTKVPSPFTSHPSDAISSLQNSHLEPDVAKLKENQKRLEDNLRSTEEQLAEYKKKIDVERKNGYLVKVLQEKLVNKRRQIKTMCTQKKRLTKRLDGCREELEKTRKALEMVETQAVLWNNLNMSDLGKLIFSLHTGKNKKSLDSRGAASRAPPEVKGFVISLFMTSPLAYQLVRDCFNGLPHPKTVSKWLHGERVDDSELGLKKAQINEVTLEETFSRVIDNECVKVDNSLQQENLSSTIDGTLLGNDNGEIECATSVDDGNAIYYVLDEKGNVAGQLTNPPPDIIFSSEGFEMAEVSQHEVVIAE